MKETQVILLRRKGFPHDVVLGRASALNSADTTGFSVEVEEIDRARVHARMQELAQNREVIACAPEIPMKLIRPFSIPCASNAVSGNIAWGVKAVGADRSPFSGAGVVVAILDTGIDKNHGAFQGVNVVEKDFTGEGNGDQDGHGTHCAGIVFGRITNGIRIGVAPGVQTALIGKVLGRDGGSSQTIVSAIQWAVAQGAHVISMSLGIDFPGLVKVLVDEGLRTEVATSRALEGYLANVRLFETLASSIRAQAKFFQNTIMVAAAGNESDRKACPPFEISVGSPAVAEGIISVAALEQSEEGLNVARFSNTGATLSGPGVDILSAAPGGGTQCLNGTSMAAPHVAGVAALWAEKMAKTQSISPLILSASLIASATTRGLRSGSKPFDVGAGIVCAPEFLI